MTSLLKDNFMRNTKKETQAAMGRIDLYKPFLLISSHNNDAEQACAIADDIADYIDGLNGSVKRLAVHEVAQTAITFANNKDEIAAEACLDVIYNFIGDSDMQKRCAYTDKTYPYTHVSDWALQSFIYVGRALNEMSSEQDASNRKLKNACVMQNGG
jgi:hypothetical protein